MNIPNVPQILQGLPFATDHAQGIALPDAFWDFRDIRPWHLFGLPADINEEAFVNSLNFVNDDIQTGNVQQTAHFIQNPGALAPWLPAQQFPPFFEFYLRIIRHTHGLPDAQQEVVHLQATNWPSMIVNDWDQGEILSPVEIHYRFYQALWGAGWILFNMGEDDLIPRALHLF